MNSTSRSNQSEHLFSKRAEREAHQVACAKTAYKAVRKSIPKELRKRDVNEARRLKQEAFVSATTPVAEEQGAFGAVTAMAASVAAFSLVRLNKTTKQTGSAVESFFDTLKKRLDEFVSFCKTTLGDLWLIPAMLLAHQILSGFVHIPIVTFMCGGMMVKIFGQQIWELVKGYFMPQEQMGGPLCSTGALICTVVCASMLPMKTVPGALGELMKRVGSFDRTKDGFESIFGYAIKYAEKAVNCLLGLFCSKQVQWMDASERYVDKFVRDVDAVELLLKDGGQTVTLEQLIAASKLQLDAIGFKATVRDGRLRVTVDKSLARLNTLLIPYNSSITGARNYRAEPIFGCFYGKTSVGKTLLMTKFACAALVKSGLTKPEHALMNLWQRGTTEYWNGYANQKCVMMDDCFQNLPVKGDLDSEFMQIIRMVGSWAYALNFADLESKGKFYFDTPLILGTTNCANIANQAGCVLVSPEAVVRRIKHPYEVCVSEGYCDEQGRLRYDLVNAEYNSNLLRFSEDPATRGPDAFFKAFPWHAWYLVRHDFSNGLTVGARRSVTDVLDEIVAQLVHNNKAHELELKNLDFWLRGFNEKPIEEVLEDYSALASENALFTHTGEPTPVSPVATTGSSQAETEPDSGLVSFAVTGGSSVASAVEQMGRFSRKQRAPDPTTIHTHSVTFADEDRETYYERFPLFGNTGGIELSEAPLQPATVGQQLRDWIARFAQKHKLLFGTLFVGAAINLTTGFQFGLGVAAKLLVQAASTIYNTVSGCIRSLFGCVGVPRRKTEQSNIKEGVAKRSTVITRPAISLQGGVIKSVAHDFIYCNAWGFELEHLDGARVSAGQIQFMESNLFAQPAHFTRNVRELLEAKRIAETSKCYFSHPVTDGKFQLTVKQYLECRRAVCQGRDVEFVALPKGSHRTAKKISQFLLTEENYQDALVASAPVRLDVFRWEVQDGKSIKNRHTMTAGGFAFVKSLNAGGTVYEDIVQYEMPTELGDCGAPLTICENKSYGGRCYLGLHTAGSPGFFTRKGFSAIITLEMFKEAKAALEVISDNFQEDLVERGIVIEHADAEEQFGMTGPGRLLNGSFEYIGKVPIGVSMSPTSKLKLSSVGEHQVFGVNPTRPAHLRPFYKDGERISPSIEGLKAFSAPPRFDDVQFLSTAVSVASKPFRDLSRLDSRIILNKEQAVKGVEGLKLKAIARATSAGYPFVLHHKNGKREFFGKEGDFDFTSDACDVLFERVDQIVESAKRGERLAHIFVDFLKDETRPHAKVDAGMTRNISAAPLDYVVAFRMYFGAFMASMFRHHTSSGLAPGINPYADWWLLATQLKSKGSKVFDGDFKRFDSTQRPLLHFAILDLVNEWYDDGPENRRVREVLWMEVVHSRHLCGEEGVQELIVQWMHNLPSGHPGTTFINSWYALICIVACWIHLTGNGANFWANVMAVTFGDDNIVNVADSAADVFNQVTISGAMDELFGLTYTCGAKDGTLVPFTTLEKCTFLKRSFVADPLVPGGWIAPLDLDSCLYRSYYYKNGRNALGETKDNVEGMLGELALHSNEVWDEYFPIARKVLADCKVAPMHINREAYREMMRARLDAWN